MYELKEMKGKSALVTGGLGFIGSNLAHKLVSLGADVVVFDACLDPYGWNLANIEEIKEKVKFIKGNVLDLELLKKSVKDKDFIFHCAGQVSHVYSMKNPFLDLEMNCKGTLNLLEACRTNGDGMKLVYAGTCGQIGKMEYSPIDEKHPTDPMDVYGINKLACEKYFILYNKVYGMDSCSVRISYNYGPRQMVRHLDYGIFNYFVRMAIEGKEIAIYEPGTQLRDYNYVEDSIDAMILCSQSKKAFGEVFMLGSGKPIKFIDMVKSIVEATGTGSCKLVPWPKERKAIEKGDYFASFEKIKNTLGWIPKTTFSKGLKKTVEFYKKRLNEYI